MPKRVRAQRLEEESRRAFADALGESYLFRDEVPDLSIDGGVEQFGSDDRPTGLRYLVQLKATDAEPAGSHLTVPIPVETATYYGALPLPVLMIRYFSTTGDLYARWFHGLEVGRDAPEGQKSVTFRWRPDDRFDSTTPDRLAAEARSFLELRSSQPHLPLPFGFSASTIAGVTPAELEIVLRDEARARADLIDLRPDNPDGGGRFVVTDIGLAVELPGVVSASYELSETYDPGVDGRQLAVDLLVLAGVALARWGQAEAAARITSTYFLRSTLSDNIEAAMLLAAQMGRARRIEEALDLAKALDSGPERGEIAFAFTLPAQAHNRTLTDREAGLLQETLRSRIEVREQSGDLLRAAREYVNLGNHHRARLEAEVAVPLYERAGECDPEYLERSHYWAELAGALFLSGEPGPAAEAYARALELDPEPDPFLELLRADCLLYAGGYSAAREVFKRVDFSEFSVERAAEYVLKQFVLDDLIERLGLDEQERDSEGAARLIEGCKNLSDDDAIEAAMLDALRLDGLAGNAWFNLAHGHRRRDEGVAGSLFISAAVLNEGDEEAWALATILTFEHGDMMLVPLIFMTGERLTGGRLSAQMARVTREQMDPERRDRFLAVFRKIQTELAEPESDAFVLRGVDPGQPVRTTILPGATASL